jgi:A/G-specific adenine glycosylase
VIEPSLHVALRQPSSQRAAAHPSAPPGTGPLLSPAAWADLRRWFERHGRHSLPWRRDRTPWRVLVAEAILHRTRADTASRVFSEVAAEFPDPASVLACADRWRELIRPAGLAWRGEAFLACCRALVDEFEGEVPASFELLSRLPGVGHYAASAVLCFAFGARISLVDTNTIRLASRISGIPLPPSAHRAARAHALVSRLGDRGQPPDATDNFALLDIAALVCRPNAPRCDICPLCPVCVVGAG